MRVLHLVLFHDVEPYISLAKLSQSFYKSFESRGVQTYYYFFDPTVNVITQDGMFLRIPGVETVVPGILDKTLAAIQYFCDEKKEQSAFDFLVRSNASTVINFYTILPILFARRDTLMYGGLQMFERTKTEPNYMHENLEHLYPLTYVQGTCIVLHKNAICALITNIARISNKPIDDIAIGLFFKQLSIDKPTEFPDMLWKVQCIGSLELVYKPTTNLNNVCAFRNMHPKKRELDIKDMEEEICVLQLRHEEIPKGQLPLVVDTVFYHNMNVTAFIVLICKVNLQWKTNGANNMLDYLFGDPEVGVEKTLRLIFGNGLEFKNNASWVFSLQKNKLTVA